MRHQKKGFKLGRTASHRKATLAALSNALIRHKRITTTWTKARALRMFVEPIINRAKEDTTHNRRQAFRYLQDKETVTELFGDIASHIGERPGGYTRVIKLGQRAGDSAEMAMIELVDYNDVQPDGGSKSKKRKTRRAGHKRTVETETAPAAVDAVTEVAEDVEVAEPEAEAQVEEPAAEVVEEVEAAKPEAEVEEPAAEVVEEVEAAEPEAEAEVEEPAAEAEVDEATAAKETDSKSENDSESPEAPEAPEAESDGESDDSEKSAK